MSNIKSRWRLGINILFSCVFTETVDRWAWPCRRNSRQSPQLGSWRRRTWTSLRSRVPCSSSRVPHQADLHGWYGGGWRHVSSSIYTSHLVSTGLRTPAGRHTGMSTAPPPPCLSPPPRRSQAADSAQTRWWPGGPAQTCQRCLTRFGKENTSKTTNNTFSLKSTFL